MKHLINVKAKHTYQLDTDKGKILVDADNRSSARKIAEKEGYIVKDVNMVG